MTSFTRLTAALCLFLASESSAQDRLTLAGTVTDSLLGMPVSGAEVRLMSGNFIRATDETDENGEYSIEARSGTYRLVVLVGESGFGLGARPSVETEGIELLVDQTRDVVVPPVFDVTGQVKDADGVAFPHILASASRRGPFEVFADEEGSYRLQLIAGTYSFFVGAEGISVEVSTTVSGDAQQDILVSSGSTEFFSDATLRRLPLAEVSNASRDAGSADLDGDGDRDILVAIGNIGDFVGGTNDGDVTNRLLINDGSGIFTDATDERMPRQQRNSQDTALGDLDGDGDTDAVAVALSGEHELYLNDGDGFFSDAGQRLPDTERALSVSAVDVDADGDLDLAIGTSEENLLLLNAGGFFTDESLERFPDQAETTMDLAPGDIDGDGDIDFAVANFASRNRLWLNIGGGVFIDQPVLDEGFAGSTREIDFADVDADGDLDMYFANANARQNRLFRNDSGEFTDVTASQLPEDSFTSYDAEFVDLDGDEDLDIVVASRGSTLIPGASRIAAYVNDGSGSFSDVSTDIFPDDLVLQGTDVEPADFDGDDRVDLYLCALVGTDRLVIGHKTGSPQGLPVTSVPTALGDDTRETLTDALAGYSNPFSVRIGQGAGFQSWLAVEQAAQLLSVSADSVWMWDVRPNSNLSPGIAQRFGAVYALNEDGFFLLPVERQAIHDGLESTAFDPDEFFGLVRMNSIVVDLGGVFRVNRLRFFPRLDRTNKTRFLQEFRVFTADESLGGPYRSLLTFFADNPNVEPVVDRSFNSRDVRFVLIEPLTNREWEIAELEVFGDGTLPIGEFISRPLRTPVNNPVWGKALFDGGELADADAVVQTRTGSDPFPVLFHLLKGDELVQVNQTEYEGALEGLKGPITSNPEWSPWQTVSDGIIRSPGLRPYMQFRLAFSVPDSRIRRLVFEYSHPSLASNLAAEIAPEIVEPGVETEFTISLIVRLTTVTTRTRPRDSGFRLIQINTAADIGEVVRVLVDDVEVNATVTKRVGGFDVKLWRRVSQNGTIVQVVFRGTVFQDRTRFEVRAVDRRLTEDAGDEEAAQFASAGDADETTLEQGLVVSLASEGEQLPLLINVEPRSKVFTPNGDGVHDSFILEYTLLKLTAPAPVALKIFGLDGRLRRTAFQTANGNGVFSATWDGRQDSGEPAPPGVYIYELRVDSDRRTERSHGVVGVAY